MKEESPQSNRRYARTANIPMGQSRTNVMFWGVGPFTVQPQTRTHCWELGLARLSAVSKWNQARGKN